MILHFNVLTEIRRKVAYTGNIIPACLSHVCTLYKRIPTEIYSFPPLSQRSHHGTNCCTSHIPHKIFKKNRIIYNFYESIIIDIEELKVSLSLSSINQIKKLKYNVIM